MTESFSALFHMHPAICMSLSRKAMPIILLTRVMPGILIICSQAPTQASMNLRFILNGQTVSLPLPPTPQTARTL